MIINFLLYHKQDNKKWSSKSGLQCDKMVHQIKRKIWSYLLYYFFYILHSLIVKNIYLFREHEPPDLEQLFLNKK